MVPHQFEWYVLKHLPVKDCLPFKVGNNILELRKMPKDAVADKFDYKFVYKKNGASKEFAVSALPDSSWEFVERKQVLVEKGKNNIPLINDFVLKTENDNDTTEAVLSQPGEYYMVLAKDFNNDDKWYENFKLFYTKNKGVLPVFLVTSDPATAKKIFAIPGLVILSCDGTALKTAARVNPTLYLMNGPVVKSKKAFMDF